MIRLASFFVFLSMQGIANSSDLHLESFQPLHSAKYESGNTVQFPLSLDVQRNPKGQISHLQQILISKNDKMLLALSPVEIWVKIFNYLDLTSLLNARATCSSFRSIFDQNIPIRFKIDSGLMGTFKSMTKLKKKNVHRLSVIDSIYLTPPTIDKTGGLIIWNTHLFNSILAVPLHITLVVRKLENEGAIPSLYTSRQAWAPLFEAEEKKEGSPLYLLLKNIENYERFSKKEKITLNKLVKKVWGPMLVFPEMSNHRLIIETHVMHIQPIFGFLVKLNPPIRARLLQDSSLTHQHYLVNLKSFGEVFSEDAWNGSFLRDALPFIKELPMHHIHSSCCKLKLIKNSRERAPCFLLFLDNRYIDAISWFIEEFSKLPDQNARVRLLILLEPVRQTNKRLYVMMIIFFSSLPITEHNHVRLKSMTELIDPYDNWQTIGWNLIKIKDPSERVLFPALFKKYMLPYVGYDFTERLVSCWGCHDLFKTIEKVCELPDHNTRKNLLKLVAHFNPGTGSEYQEMIHIFSWLPITEHTEERGQNLFCLAERRLAVCLRDSGGLSRWMEFSPEERSHYLSLLTMEMIKKLGHGYYIARFLEAIISISNDDYLKLKDFQCSYLYDRRVSGEQYTRMTEFFSIITPSSDHQRQKHQFLELFGELKSEVWKRFISLVPIYPLKIDTYERVKFLIQISYSSKDIYNFARRLRKINEPEERFQYIFLLMSKTSETYKFRYLQDLRNELVKLPNHSDRVSCVERYLNCYS